MTARVRALLAGLEDLYPLRRRRREALDDVATDLRKAQVARAIRTLRRDRTGEPSPVDALSGRAIAGPAEALRAADRAVAAAEERWAALARAVEEAEETRGGEPPAPDPAALAELSLLTSAVAALREGFAPRGASLRGVPDGTTIDRVAAVGVGIVAAALGAPHVAVHLAMSAGEAVGKTRRGRRAPPRHAGTLAMQALRGGIARGEPSAEGLLDALDDLARAPRDRATWERFVEAAQERVAALGRTHLRSRAAAVLENGEPA